MLSGTLPGLQLPVLKAVGHLKVFCHICHREAGPARCLRYLRSSQEALKFLGLASWLEPIVNEFKRMIWLNQSRSTAWKTRSPLTLGYLPIKTTVGCLSLELSPKWSCKLKNERNRGGKKLPMCPPVPSKFFPVKSFFPLQHFVLLSLSYLLPQTLSSFSAGGNCRRSVQRESPAPARALPKASLLVAWALR